MPLALIPNIWKAKTKKYKTTTIVIYNIYNSNGHFVYFKDLEMKGVDAYYNNTGGITT